MTARRPHKWTMLVLGVGCSALFLWLAFRNTDFRSIGTSLKAAEPLYALPFLAFLFVFYWLKSMRWSDLLAPNAVIGAGQASVMVAAGGM